MKIIISTSSFADYNTSPLDLLREAGVEFELNPHGRKLTSDECFSLYKDIDGLIAGTEELTAEILRSARKLRVISRCGTGMDNINIKAAKELGIKVLNTPDAPTQAVAELTIGLMLDLLRCLSAQDRLVRSGAWQKVMGNLLSGKVIGILGLGRIGRRVVALTQPFNLRYIVWDTVPDRRFGNKYGIEFGRLDELLSKVDIVTIHLPYVPELKGIIGEREINLMKKDALLINAARGGLVDELALYKALKNKRIAGAALDAFEQEPYSGSLKELDNVILTPHIGSYAKEARVDMEIQSVKNLLQGFGL